MLPPLGRATTQVDLITESLREAILSGRIAIDEVLVERRVAEQLGVSKTPVREALIRLANSGLVTSSSSRGVRVRRLTRLDAQRIYEQRILLEPWAVASAIEASAIDLREAERLCDEAALHLESGDLTAMALVNRRLHRAVYSACPNDFVVATLDQMQDLTALATLSVFWELSMTAAPELGEHRQLLDFAREGDSGSAAQLMRVHIGRSLDRVARASGVTNDRATGDARPEAADQR